MANLLNGFRSGERDPDSPNYRPDRYNTDGSYTKEYAEALRKDEQERVKEQGPGKGFYDRDTDTLYQWSWDKGDWVPAKGGGSHGSSYDDALRAARRAQEARIEKAVSQVESQRPTIEQQAQEAARQAYINQQLALRDIPQQLAATGQSGGLTDSAMLGLNTNYQNIHNNILQNRDNALNQLNSQIADIRRCV